MRILRSFFFAVATAALIVTLLAPSGRVAAQSRPQKPDPSKGEGKRNQRPVPKTEEELKKEEEERRRLEEEKNAIPEEGVERVESKIVSVNSVVYNKKTGQIVTGLKKENFAIFEDGVKQEISSFSTPEAPITVTLVVEYSKWSERLGAAGGGYWEPGTYEVLRPVAQFLSGFIKPPDDYASVIAFDLRPTPITDFTNDPNRLRATVDLLLKNRPAFTDSNLFDALIFSLVGGKADAVVLENSKERTAMYGGMVDVKAKRRAILLVASGLNTFGRSNLNDVRKVIQEAGVPIYIISTGNLFYKKYEHLLDATDSISGAPGRLSFLQARNQLQTFARESGGALFEMTFPSEINAYLNSINGLLRNQYSLAYDLQGQRTPGKRHKIDVKVDVDGDGVYDEKQFIVQHRLFYIASDPNANKGGK
ncbi:MAG: VWA domain-containing protein [Pyrinomonadaceae bacterium]